MAQAGDKTPSSAGISPIEEVDVATLFERLRSEVRKGTSRPGADGSGRSELRFRYRGEAERLWPVSAERPFTFRSRRRSILLRPVKVVLRSLMRWYVEPFAADQRGFNDAVLKLLDGLYEDTDGLYERYARLRERLEGAVEADRRLVEELEERLTRLERRDRGPRTVAGQPGAAAVPDYFAFESRMRGSTAEIRERQRVYVADFRDAAPVLDVGCGRGEFLGLLREAGIEARGVDADVDMVAYARGEGLDVEQADALAYLEGIEDGSLGGIFAAQLVEHLPPAALLRLLEFAAAKLRPGGLLVAETINPLSPLALRNFFADLTHARPLVPETFVLLARQAGFDKVETRFLNEPERKLQPPDDPVLAENVRRLNELLFGPLDYAILART